MLNAWWKAACFCLSKNVLISSLSFTGNMSEHTIHKTVISFNTSSLTLVLQCVCVLVHACVCAATEHARRSEHNWQELPLCFHRGVVGTELKSPGLVARDFAKPNRPESFLEGLLSSVVSVEHRPAERTGLGCFNVLWPILKKCI